MVMVAGAVGPAGTPPPLRRSPPPRRPRAATTPAGCSCNRPSFLFLPIALSAAAAGRCRPGRCRPRSPWRGRAGACVCVGVGLRRGRRVTAGCVVLSPKPPHATHALLPLAARGPHEPKCAATRASTSPRLDHRRPSCQLLPHVRTGTRGPCRKGPRPMCASSAAAAGSKAAAKPPRPVPSPPPRHGTPVVAAPAAHHRPWLPLPPPRARRPLLPARGSPYDGDVGDACRNPRC